MSNRERFLALSFILALVTITWAIQDPELEKCHHQCGKQRQYDEAQIRDCKDKCQRYYREKQRRERERGGGDTNPRYEGGERKEQSEREEESEPYVFQDQHFHTKFQSYHGRVRILQMFNERSELLRGIENYRVAIFETNPRRSKCLITGMLIFFSLFNKGTISLIREDKRERFNIRHGDVVKIDAGTTVYTVNHGNNEELIMVELLLPVSTPGHFEAFFGPGGENTESFFRAFSSELLKAAFNTGREKFEKVFQKQREGMIIKASEEQIRSMSHHEEGPYNIFKQHPSHSNQHGQYFEVDSSECKDLQDLDLGIAFVNISQGSMMPPMYNSRATKIAVVVSGEGYLEIACPHLSSSEFGQKEQHGGSSSRQRQITPSYKRVSANIRRGTVFVIPAGHPFITVASQNENLQVLCFEVNAENNKKFQLAGKRNIFNQFESEAKELAFGVSEQEVDEVFKSQKEEFFVKGPHQQRKGLVYA